MSATLDIRHEPERTRFVAYLDDQPTEATLKYRVSGEHELEYYSTFTPPELRGQGIGGRLVRFALDYALSHDKAVVPTCPFVAKTLHDEPKYSKLRR